MAPAGPAGRPEVGQRGKGGRGKLWEEAEGKGLHPALAAGKRAYVHYITYTLEDHDFFLPESGRPRHPVGFLSSLVIAGAPSGAFARARFSIYGPNDMKSQLLPVLVHGAILGAGGLTNPPHQRMAH